jgi:hypothetical protein
MIGDSLQTNPESMHFLFKRHEVMLYHSHLCIFAYSLLENGFFENVNIGFTGLLLVPDCGSSGGRR